MREGNTRLRREEEMRMEGNIEKRRGMRREEQEERRRDEEEEE
jgi:hypothetical protein